MIGKYKIAALCICRIQDRECFELIHELDGQLDNIGCRLFVYNCISRPDKNSSSAETAVFDLIDPPSAMWLLFSLIVSGIMTSAKL